MRYCGVTPKLRTNIMCALACRENWGESRIALLQAPLLTLLPQIRSPSQKSPCHRTRHSSCLSVNRGFSSLPANKFITSSLKSQWAPHPLDYKACLPQPLLIQNAPVISVWPYGTCSVLFPQAMSVCDK